MSCEWGGTGVGDGSASGASALNFCEDLGFYGVGYGRWFQSSSV